MTLSEEEIRSIGRETGKKVTIQAKCRERARVVSDARTYLSKKERDLAATVESGDTKRILKKMKSEVEDSIDGANALFLDSPMKTVILDSLTTAKTIADGADKEDPVGAVQEIAREFDSLIHDKLFTMMLADFKQCECESPEEAQLLEYFDKYKEEILKDSQTMPLENFLSRWNIDMARWKMLIERWHAMFIEP